MEELTLNTLVAKIKSDDPEVRTQAWLGAGRVGAVAIKPLAKLVAEGELEVGRAAKRAMWKIVRTAGAPDGGDAKQAVVEELIGLLGPQQPAAVQREVLWMLSEIGGDETVAAVREIPDGLKNKEIREDIRCCVERIPGRASIDALVEALEAAPNDFALAIAQSLRARGVEVDSEKYPCQKMIPTKQTSVKPVGR